MLTGSYIHNDKDALGIECSVIGRMIMTEKEQL